MNSEEPRIYQRKFHILRVLLTHVQPDIGKFPVEFYGTFYNNRDKAKEGMENDHCPFLNSTCKKRRKSQGESIGTCSVGYRGRGQAEYRPHCICPHRFETDSVLGELRDLLIKDGEYFTTPEVPLLGASIDYVVGKKSPENEVLDFAGVEIQALDTTGSVWDYREAYFDDEMNMETVDQTYGINWTMSLTKTMMQQAFKKGQVFRDWGEKLVFLVQDVSIGYLRDNYDASGLRDARPEDPIHFYTYSLIYNYDTDEYEWEINEKLSADIEGVTGMMVAPDDQTPPSRQEFAELVGNRL